MEELPCKGNTDLFFPASDRHRKGRVKPYEDAAGVRRARELCNSCARRVQCVDEGVWYGATDGIWGGVHFGRPAEHRAAHREWQVRHPGQKLPADRTTRPPLPLSR